MNHQPKRSERIRNSLPYALLLLAGLACIVLIALSAVGRQGIGWLLGQNLQSELEANYNEQITLTIPAVDATRIAELQATDEAGLLITPGPGTIVTVPPGQFTPGPTVIALITDTPTPTPTPRPTNTFTPTSTNTPTPTNSYCICGEVVKEMDEPVDPKDLWCPAHGRIADLVLYTKPLSCGVPTPAGLLCGEPLYEKQSTAQLHAEMTNFKPDPDDFPEPLDTI